VRKLAGYVTLAATAALGLWFAQAPVSQADLTATSPVLLDRNESWLNVRTVEGGTWRIGTDLDSIDPAFLNALIEIEDRRFYTHSGVDGAAILRALKSWQEAGDVVSGASTITMQLVRQYKPRPRTMRSKVIESLEALRFELHFTKSEILEQYLTRISYGGNIEGIEAASRIYLGKPAKYLSPDEIALLIALPQAPEARRPDRNAQGAKGGRDRILKRLAHAGLLEPQSLTESLTAPIPLAKADLPNAAWLTAERLVEQGRTVQSFIEPALQRATENRLSDYVDGLPEPVNASAIIVHAPTREVRGHAAIGRRDHDGGWLDMTAAIRSPGSTLKPFVYGLGMDDGLIGQDTRLRDAPSRFGSYRPENFDRRYYGDVTMAQALQHSLNVPAVSVLDRVGGRRLDATLRAAGVSPSQTGPGADGADAGLALALGGTGLSARDLAVLYTAIANDGLAAPLKWTVADGDSDESFTLLQKDTAKTLRDVMSTAPRPAGILPTHLGLKAPDIGYKTGTSYGFRDSWAAGLSGDYVIIVWVGRPDGGPRPGVTGREAAAPLLFGIANDLPYKASRQPLHAKSKASVKLASADEIAPVILFPADGTEVALAAFGPESEGVDLVVQSAYENPRLYIDAKPVEKTRQGFRFMPDSPGFYDLVVVDNKGHETRGTFRVLSAKDISHPGF